MLKRIGSEKIQAETLAEWIQTHGLQKVIDAVESLEALDAAAKAGRAKKVRSREGWLHWWLHDPKGGVLHEDVAARRKKEAKAQSHAREQEKGKRAEAAARADQERKQAAIDRWIEDLDEEGWRALVEEVAEHFGGQTAGKVRKTTSKAECKSNVYVRGYLASKMFPYKEIER